MMRTMCKSKIHGATVTESNLHYVGSLTIDRALMRASGIAPYEWLHVANVTTGARFETYAIEGEEGSGAIGLNGAAARLGAIGDKLIIMCSAMIGEDELEHFTPKVVFVDEQNRIVTPSVSDRGWDLNTEADMNAAMREATRGTR